MAKYKSKSCILIPEAEDDGEKDMKHIRITLCGYKNIVPTYLITDLTVQAIHANHDMGLSTKTTVTDDVYYSTSFDFVLQCNINSSHSVDTIISHPVTFKVFEHPGHGDSKLMGQLTKPLKPMHQEKIITSAESAANLHEAFTGKAFNRSGLLPVQKSTLLQTSKKDIRELSKLTVGSSKHLRETATSDVELPKDPILFGTTNLDLLPLFTGNKCFTESLLIYKTEKLYDDQMIPARLMPRLMVEVTIDENTWLSNDCTNVISLTVESIYHIPEPLGSNMFYSISSWLPSPHGKFEHFIIPGGKWRESVNLCRMKQWPRTHSPLGADDKINQDTKYRIDDCVEGIQNKLEVDVETILNSQLPRIEFNTIKRNYLTKQANRELHKTLKKYRHIPFEIYVSEHEGKASAPKDSANNLHLMAEVNVATLLYPGVTKLRVVCPLSTFQENEIQKLTGVPNSPFFVKKVVTPLSPPVLKPKDDKPKTGAKAELPPPSKTEIKPIFLVPVIEVEDPSIPIYHENHRTFVLLEVELLVPLEMKRTIEDLTQNLLEILPPRPKLSKHIISEHLSEKYFTAVIKKLLEDLLHQHDNYITDLVTCACTEFGEVDLPNTFLTFLRKNGMYETYVTSMTRAVTTIVNEKKPYVGDPNVNNKEYQDFISIVYTDLVKQTNSLVNEICNSGVEVKSTVKPLPDSESFLLYAKEACELGATLLADRYFLERICQSENSESYWFDYAVFQLEMGDREKAFECVKQSLLINDKYKYSLVLFGILLNEKKSHEEAETCFLSAMFLNPKWLEGWGTMHLFYLSVGNGEGADLCQEMANKCMKNYKPDKNYFCTFDDLAWTTEFCPKTVFYRTAMFLIKTRALQYAERALVLAQKSDPGLYHYYLAAIMYYHHEYKHCLMHLEEAENIRGLDYAIGALKGHALLALDNLTQAKAEYLRVLEMFNRPTDLHLVYVYLALILERLDDKQQSRKLLLLVCKYSPTPYAWLATGLLYYGQRDLISADQCLLQANLCDNRLAEVWGYLVIINLELGSYNEAEMCYKQIKKNKIENKELLEKIEETWKCVRK